MPFTIAIAGRPNVGKSTLFNRLVGKAMALVSDEPGVTRDWREGEGHLFDLSFRVLDTAGLEDVRIKGSLSARTAAQTKQALEQTHLVLFVVDGRQGLTPKIRPSRVSFAKQANRSSLSPTSARGPICRAH